MANTSARSIYLLVTFIIILLFAGTGAFYFFNIKQEQKTQTEEPQVAQVYVQETAPTPQATPQALRECYQSCEFTFQCSGMLECMTIENSKICVNNRCPNSSTCVCDGTTEIQDESSKSAVTVSPTPQPTSAPEDSEVYTQEEDYNPSLPAAGTQNLSILISILGILGLASGIVLKKIKS